MGASRAGIYASAFQWFIDFNIFIHYDKRKGAGENSFKQRISRRPTQIEADFWYPRSSVGTHKGLHSHGPWERDEVRILCSGIQR